MACLVMPVAGQQPAAAPGRPEIPVARSAGPPDRSPPPEASAWTNLVIRPAGAGVFELGPVRFDRATRTATFPATINMLQGPVEYLIVSGYGKTHESILRTSAEPFHVHLAMLLMDAKAAGMPTNESVAPALRPPQQPGQILAPAAQPVAGDRVHVEVEWERGGQKLRQPASDFITNAREGRAMSDGPWTYSGGQVVQGFFTPQQTGSIAAVITDPDALINNPRAGHENDDIWLVDTNAIPPLNTPVQVIIQLR
ncbi:MAG: YdjY domain-containing protein [Limisphaerales bacterium]